MNYCIKYMAEIRDKILKCSLSQINKKMGINCRKEVKHLIKIIYGILEDYETSPTILCSSITEYTNNLKDQDNYFYIINSLKELYEELKDRSNKIIPQNEKNNLINVLSDLEIKSLRIYGYSEKTFQRMRKEDKKIPLVKIYQLINYFYYPELNNTKDGFKAFFITTQKFIHSLKGELGKLNRQIEALEILIAEAPREEEQQNFLYNIFNALYILDERKLESKDILNHKIWGQIDNIIISAAENSLISDSEIEKFRDEVLPDIHKDYYFYRQTLEEENTFNDYGFKAIIFYRFYHHMLIYGEKKCEDTWLILADKVYRKAILLTHNILHPYCLIKAPCRISGTNVYIGKECFINSRCCIFGCVNILGSDAASSSEKVKTTIGDGVIINRGAIILPGVQVKNFCILNSFCVISDNLKSFTHVISEEQFCEIKETDYEKLYENFLLGKE